MIRRILILVMLAIMSLGAIHGCETMGEITGETADKVEEGAEDFEKGYEEKRND